jgi:hypothetical protein
VIVLWTKTESLDDDMITELMNKGNSLSEAEQQAPQKAWVKYEKETYQYFNGFKYPPKAYVVFRSMSYPYPVSLFDNYLANCLVQRCMSLELVVMT